MMAIADARRANARQVQDIPVARADANLKAAVSIDPIALIVPTAKNRTVNQVSQETMIDPLEKIARIGLTGPKDQRAPNGPNGPTGQKDPTVTTGPIARVMLAANPLSAKALNQAVAAAHTQVQKDPAMQIARDQNHRPEKGPQA